MLVITRLNSPRLDCKVARIWLVFQQQFRWCSIWPPACHDRRTQMSTYLFSSFSKKTKAAFTHQTITKGETLFREGDRAEQVYLVETGCIRLVVYPHESKELVLYRARDGEAFAEDQLVNELYTYTAIADKPTSLVVAVKSDVMREFSHDHIVARSFLQCICRRYYQLRVNFERIGIKSAADRVMHLLKSLEQDRTEININGRIKSLSRDLNLTHEAMYRALRELEDLGLIEREEGVIRLTKVDEKQNDEHNAIE